MNLRSILTATSVTVLTLAPVGVARADLTIEQAEQLSQRTGRPILAVAGSRT